MKNRLKSRANFWSLMIRFLWKRRFNFVENNKTYDIEIVGQKW